ncbi:polymorphic toxin-type HINT domain-containing protein [Gimesia maris]|uniref:polymorphic toxin-type HINT domain-containing protein n=1 Tax=Gimesia maris TaxID=122 RepID=UPI001E318175|nr:polymorphic toxin-type HINT domain-containing protein [Gimesia maris]
MHTYTRKLLIFSCFLFTSFCFWKAGAGLIGDTDTEILPSAHATMSPSISPPRVVTTPIQQMRPGMRVVGRNPLRWETEATIDPTPEGWRLVSVQMRKEDGTYFEAELLRPLSWIRRHQAQPGAVIELNMPELHVVGAAEVLAVSACPPIDPGDGPVVLSTFKNVAKNVLDIYVEGEAEPIGVTAGHPIWSEDRQAFIHSDQLQPGERLRSAVGRTVRITSIEIRAGPEPVYNLEVAGEHVYSVTGSGLLVHNVSDCDLVTKIGLPDGSYIDLNAPRSSVPRYGTPFQPLSKSQRTALKSKLDDRTITQQEFKHLEWDRRFANRRATGVRRFWASERVRLRAGEPGTRAWTPEQAEAILAGRKPQFNGETLEGHHLFNALDHPHIANESWNIYPATRTEHFQRWHGGNWQNDTFGQPLNPLFFEEF